MLADFYIPRLLHDMKISIQKNHLRGQIFYKSLDPSKKTASLWKNGKRTMVAKNIFMH